MEKSYRIRYRDVLLANIYLLPHMKTMRSVYAVLLAASILIGALYASSGHSGAVVHILTIALFAAAFQVLIIAVVFLLFTVMNCVHPTFRRLYADDIKVILTESEYQEVTAVGRQINTWDQVTNVIENDFSILFLITDFNINLIPNRFFADEREAHQFYVYAKKQWYNARHPEDKIP